MASFDILLTRGDMNFDINVILSQSFDVIFDGLQPADWSGGA